MSEQTATPSSHWRAEGQADPHAGHYDGERATLAMGNLTDDQLANAAFMFYNDDPSLQTLSDRWLPHWPFYNDYPSLQDVMDGKAFPPIAYMTAVKDRIRWLSRSLERVVSERDALAAELKGVRVTQQAPTTEDINLQEWKGMDGACAWHLIDRHADDWNHVARLMNAWLEANREGLVAELKALRGQKPVARIDDDENFQGPCRHAMAFVPMHRGAPLYARPVPGRELTDADIALCIASADKSFAQERISGKPVLGVWSKHLARAIERYLKGEGK